MQGHLTVCPKCGKVSDPQDGACPVCLLGLALSEEPQNDRPSEQERSNRPSEPSRRFADYELISEIARGGMGVVYKARQLSLNRIVAVKMLIFGRFASDEFVRRFKREAAAIASLKHPHIVAIHELGECEGIAYFSMDYIEGEELSARVRAQPIPARGAATQVQVLARAVHYAHERGVVHRDLKPSNIMVDVSGELRITDFGLAKQVGGDRTLTQTDGFFGSPGYMAPEQAFPQGKDHSGKAADVYSLGAILYFLLTGRPPFLATTLQDTLVELRNGEVVPPRMLNRSIPRDLEVICLKCLEKNPSLRYDSANELAQELGRFLDGEPVKARPIHFARRAWRWCHRRPALAAGLGLLMLITASSIAVAVRMHQMRERIRQSIYAADMNVASRYVQENNLGHALALLHKHQPRAGGKDLRGFEWAYLWARCQESAGIAYPAHKQVAGTLAFAPDGTRAAAFYWDRHAIMWNVGDRRSTYTAQGVTPAGGFTAEGSLCLSDAAGTLQVIDPDTAKVLRSWTKAGELLQVSRSGGAALLLVASQRLETRDLSDGRRTFSARLPRPLRADFGLRPPVAISPDQSQVAVALSSIREHDGPREIFLWDTRSGQLLTNFMQESVVRCLEFDTTSETLASGLSDGEISLWNLKTKERRLLSGHDGPVLSLAFGATNSLLASGSSDQSIRVWMLSAGKVPSLTNLFWHPGEVWSLVFSPDDRYLASGGRDSPIRLWDPARPVPTRVISGLLTDDYANFVFSADSRWIAAGCLDRSVKVWDAATLRLHATLSGAAFVVSFSRDGKSLLAAGQDNLPAWWDIATQKKRAVPPYAGGLTITSVDLSPNKQMAALGGESGGIQLVDIESGRLLRTLPGHSNSVESLMFSPNGDQLLSGGRDRFLRLWNVETGKGVDRCQEHKGGIFAVAISPDGQSVASGCGANTIKLWNPKRLDRSASSFSYHESVVRSLAFSPDKKTLASGSDDKTMKLWRLPFGDEVASFKFSHPVRRVAFSSDGRNLGVLTKGGELTNFRIPTLSQADQDDPPLR